jgi:hypothetical protein
MKRQKMRTWTIYDEKAISSHMLKLPLKGIRGWDFFFEILEQIYPGQVLLSQYIDIRQHHHRDIRLLESDLCQLFNIEMKVSKSFIDLGEDEESSGEYYVHVKGRIMDSWLRHVVMFGGTNLANIFWDNEEGIYGFNELIKWNKGVVDEIFSDASDPLAEIFEVQPFVCFTLDGWLAMIYRSDFEINSLLSKIKLVGKINNYEINVKYGELNERLI